MPLMFEQQPRESAKAFAAFSLYLSLGPERSTREVGKKLGKSEGLIERWAAKFDWTGRVAAYAAHLAVVEREAVEAARRAKGPQWEAREQQLRETEWAMHERAIAAAKRGLDAYMEREKVYANLADIARMLEIASKLGRLATDLGTEGDGRKGDEPPTVRVEVTVALEKIYGDRYGLCAGAGGRQCVQQPGVSEGSGESIGVAETGVAGWFVGHRGGAVFHDVPARRACGGLRAGGANVR